MHRVYMDANATTPLLPEVVEAMRPFWIESFGNASSIHQQGQRARAAVEAAREQVAALLNCRAAELVFTSGGTESDNLALFGILKPGDHLITTAIEHHAVIYVGHELQARGVELTVIKPDSNGVVQPGTLRAALLPNTKLVSVMLANNETGAIQPVAELAAIAHEHGALFHTDAVQAAGKIPIDVQALGVDLLSISGHKMHAPQGTGALYVRRGTRLAPLFFGGSHERQRRAGTENLAGVVGLGKASQIAQAWIANNGAEKLAALRDQLERTILAAVPGSGVTSANAPRVCNTANIYFDHLEAEALVIALDLKGLAVSGGSACQSGAADPSHVLQAIGLTPERARASVRFSLTKQTTAEDIAFATSIVPTAAAHLRDLSPAWRKLHATTTS